MFQARFTKDTLHNKRRSINLLTILKRDPVFIIIHSDANVKMYCSQQKVSEEDVTKN